MSGTPHSTAVFFFGNFGSEIQIVNQQVLGQNWVKKVVINKFSLGKK
jgi:hypothetical protein